jgi:DNA polymerase-3 subunit delta
MNQIITEADYRKLIGKTAGRAFVLFGDEDYLKSHTVKKTREAICPDEAFAVFNDITLDALDFSADKLLDAMTPPPMMADERLIVVRGLNPSNMKAAELDALIEALALLPEYNYNTVLLHVAAGLIDERGLPKRIPTVLKKLSEVATPVQFAASTDKRLAAWASKHFAHLGVTVSPADCDLLISFAGKSMYLLANEIEKIAYYVLSKGRTAATAEDIRLVAVPSMEMDTFALSNAILEGRTERALEALAVLKFERKDPLLIMGELSRTLCDMQAVRLYTDAGKSVKEIAKLLGGMHEYKAGLYHTAAKKCGVASLKRALSLCQEADSTLKSGNASYVGIEALIAAFSKG